MRLVDELEKALVLLGGIDLSAQQAGRSFFGGRMVRDHLHPSPRLKVTVAEVHPSNDRVGGGRHHDHSDSRVGWEGRGLCRIGALKLDVMRVVLGIEDHSPRVQALCFRQRGRCLSGASLSVNWCSSLA
jgi:hypothetical protein